MKNMERFAPLYQKQFLARIESLTTKLMTIEEKNHLAEMLIDFCEGILEPPYTESFFNIHGHHLSVEDQREVLQLAEEKKHLVGMKLRIVEHHQRFYIEQKFKIDNRNFLDFLLHRKRWIKRWRRLSKQGWAANHITGSAARFDSLKEAKAFVKVLLTPDKIHVIIPKK